MKHRLNKPAPITRRRLYDTGAAILGVLVVWGIITADEATQYADLIDKLLAVGLLILARRHVEV